MGRINLQSLIDEVLGMAKDDQDFKKKKISEYETAQVNQSWDDTKSGQEYWNNVRGRTTDLEKQKLLNEQKSTVQVSTPGRMARETLGTNQQGNNGKAQADFVMEMAKADPTLFTDPLRKGDLDNFKKNMGEMGFNQQQSGLNSADAPTQEEIQNLHFGGQSDKDFRKSVDSNIGLKGTGYVLNDKTGKMTRVIGNEVYGPGEAATSNNYNGAGARDFLNMTSNTLENTQKVMGGIDKKTPMKNETPSFLDIDRQITEEERKKKFTGNKYLDWGLRRAYNIAHAPVRMMGGLEYLADKNLRKVGDWEGWDK